MKTCEIHQKPIAHKKYNQLILKSQLMFLQKLKKCDEILKPICLFTTTLLASMTHQFFLFPLAFSFSTTERQRHKQKGVNQGFAMGFSTHKIINSQERTAVAKFHVLLHMTVLMVISKWESRFALPLISLCLVDWVIPYDTQETIKCWDKAYVSIINECVHLVKEW